MAGDIVDRIYEAAALPELWPDVFHALATANGFEGGGVITVNERFARGVVSPGVQALFDEYLAKGWADRNVRVRRAEALNYQGFLHERDFMTDEEVEADPMHIELLRPHGFGWGAGSVIDSPNGDKVVLIFERLYALGPIVPGALQKLDLARPHLARAALFSGRLDIEKSRAQVAALEAIGLPAAVIGANRRALAVNGLFGATLTQIRIGARDAVSMVDAAAEALFAKVISEGASGASIPLRTSQTAPGAVLHVLPVRRAARDVFSQAQWLLAVTPLGALSPPSATILSGLFDLSPAEARVARAVVQGTPVGAIATGLGLSEATVRTQLRAVFSKTGAGRQAELVALCGGLRAGNERPQAPA